MSNHGKIIIDNNSFVGLGSRSKSGCTSCRQKKKKCDEVHPVCGVCKKRGHVCEWKSRDQKKYSFNINSVIESQNQLKRVKTEAMTVQFKKNLKRKQKDKIPVSGLQLGKKKSVDKTISNEQTSTIDVQKVDGEVQLKEEEEYIEIVRDDEDNQIDIEQAVDRIMSDAQKMDDFISKMIEHVKSPAFSPSTNIVDMSLNSAIRQAQSYITKHADNIYSPQIRSTLSQLASPMFSPSQFIELKHEDADVEQFDLSSHHPLVKIEELDDSKSHDESYEELDTYAPMDESQLLENIYISDSDLINVFKSKELHPYLRPTVHLLLSKNNTLKMINPSSPIFRQLDTTAKMFLENYVTNLAMNQLDIGNNQFFLDYALSQASVEPAILYCLVAWGGMFLVGHDNVEASAYIAKSFKLIEAKKVKLSLATYEFNNEENLKLLLFYVLCFCAEICTGDVNRWFQMLLQSRDILEKYGGLRQFIHMNKDSKVARWILSNIFYHDVMCTRTLEYGPIIPISEYKDVFNNPTYLEGIDYGLDPFYGLSLDLYLLLGEVASYRKTMKNAKFPINFDITNGLCDKISDAEFKKKEDSWFKIFDSQIINCKPSSDNVELLLKHDPDGKLWEDHLTWYELTQLSLRIYIRINFKEMEFDSKDIQGLREKGFKLFKVLIGTKLQTLLGLALLMLGVTSITKKDRLRLEGIYHELLKNYEILNIRVCWEIIRLIWDKYDEQVEKGGKHYVDWPEVVNVMGWNCCFT